MGNLSKEIYSALSPFHSLSYEGRPGDALLFGACVDLVHLRQAGGAGRDEVQRFVVMGHFSYYQPLKGDHRRFVVLHESQW